MSGQKIAVTVAGDHRQSGEAARKIQMVFKRANRGKLLQAAEANYSRQCKFQSRTKISNMLAEPKLQILQDLLRSTTRDETVWLHGYLSGILANGQPQTDTKEIKPITKKLT